MKVFVIELTESQISKIKNGLEKCEPGIIHVKVSPDFRKMTGWRVTPQQNEEICEQIMDISDKIEQKYNKKRNNLIDRPFVVGESTKVH